MPATHERRKTTKNIKAVASQKQKQNEMSQGRDDEGMPFSEARHAQKFCPTLPQLSKRCGWHGGCVIKRYQFIDWRTYGF